MAGALTAPANCQLAFLHLEILLLGDTRQVAPFLTHEPAFDRQSGARSHPQTPDPLSPLPPGALLGDEGFGV
jgi:hypothetical protein